MPDLLQACYCLHTELSVLLLSPDQSNSNTYLDPDSPLKLYIPKEYEPYRALLGSGSREVMDQGKRCLCTSPQ